MGHFFSPIRPPGCILRDATQRPFEASLHIRRILRLPTVLLESCSKWHKRFIYTNLYPVSGARSAHAETDIALRGESGNSLARA